MTKELSALLRKKSWSGDEIGKAIIYSLVDAHRQALEGVASPSPAFSPDQLQLMIGSLSDPLQLRRYNSYVGLQNWLIQYQAVSTAYMKQAAGDLDVISGALNAALAVEEDLQILNGLPVILTQKQYDELRVENGKGFRLDEQVRKRGYAIIGNEFEGLAYEHRYDKVWDMALQISVRCGLEQYTALNPGREQAVTRLMEGRKTVEDGYYYVKGYDKAIELIADYLAMPEFSIFRLGAENLEERMREMEAKTLTLRTRVSGGDYGKEDVRLEKQKVLLELFSPFGWDSLEIPSSAVDAAKALLADNLRAFDRQDSAFISILTSREGGS